MSDLVPPLYVTAGNVPGRQVLAAARGRHVVGRVELHVGSGASYL